MTRRSPLAILASGILDAPRIGEAQRSAKLLRAFICAVALGFITAAAVAHAQPAGKILRIGSLCPTQCSGHPLNEKVVLPALREYGWVEGQNIAIEYRNAHGNAERLPALAAELVALNVDILTAPSQAAAEALKKATRTIPTVFVVFDDPVAKGLIMSLARPGGNMTGVAALVDARLEVKRLELLRQAAPTVTHVAVLFDPGDSFARRAITELDAAAAMLRTRLLPVEFRGPEHLESAFVAMKRERAGALHIVTSAVILRHLPRVADLAIQNRLPAIYPARQFPEAGGLMAYGPNFDDMYRRSVYFVDKILRGAKPADLPVEQPTKFELTINLKTATRLGLTIPQSLLLRADHVIE
jgi:putative tryptophan/tyrosine transport system substrate-binding protein